MTAPTLAGVFGISQHWDDTKVIAGAVATVVGAAFAVGKLLRVIGRGLSWCRDLASDIGRTLHLVEYHLGPNGDTPPMHKQVRTLTVVTADLNARMRVVEQVHGVENPEPLPSEEDA